MQVRDFHIDCDDKEILGNLILMDRSCIIWLGEKGTSPELNSLVASMQTTYDSMPLSTVLLDSEQNEAASGMSQRISKRCKIQVFLSYNLPSHFESETGFIEREVIKVISNATSAASTTEAESEISTLNIK